MNLTLIPAETVDENKTAITTPHNNTFLASQNFAIFPYY